MDQQIAVSVLCNAYNHEKYIRHALEGFVSQKTTFPFEVIVHDDASTDHTADIIREYEKKYPEIIKPIYQTENQYSKHDGSIRRAQLAHLKGKYIAFCEGDDYWTDPQKLQKQYDFMEQHPDYSLCACSTKWLNEVSGKTDKRGSIEHDMDIALEDVILEKNGRIFIFVSIFIKAEVYINQPSWGFPIGDYPLAVYAGLCGKMHMLSDMMCVYRWHTEGSWTARMESDQHRAEVSRKMIDGLMQLNQYTNFEYNNVISQRILTHKYTLALMNHDNKAIKSDELIQIYKRRNLIYRMSDRFRCQMPKAYGFVRKIMARFF